MSQSSGFPRCSARIAICGLLLAAATTTASGQAADSRASTPEAWLQAPEKTIASIRRLVLPQQKQLARFIIRQYPGTRLARLAQQLTDEYALYDQFAAPRMLEREAHIRALHEIWMPRQAALIADQPEPLTITNLSDEPVLYQVQGPSMQWSGPHNLQANASHQLHYPVVLRRVTRRGIVETMLLPGQHYVFGRLDEVPLPQLDLGR